MRYNQEFFDTYLERRNTRSAKWDGCNAKFGVDPDIELLPMWIADMDFRSPAEVVEAIAQRVKAEAFGYTTVPDSFYDAIISWIERRYHWKIEKEWIVFTPGVVPAFNVAYQAFSQPGDGIIVPSPSYYPFFDGVRNNGRKVISCPLVERGGFWSLNFGLLEQQVQDPANKLLILSNPHNPTGRCWTQQELEQLGTLCAENGVILLSDEIHADLIMAGNHHTCVGTLSQKIVDNTILHFAPSKTFNLAGLQTAYTVIPNRSLRTRFTAAITANRIINMNWFGQVALETAYNQCEGYVDALCSYVSANMDYMAAYLKENLPMLKMVPSQGTYMVWVDFRGTGMTTGEIEHFIIHKAHIAVDMGSWFGEGGEGFLRFNLACPRMLVERAMRQLCEAFSC